jgi:protein-L-isoaspartate O-methyltransferase
VHKDVPGSTPTEAGDDVVGGRTLRERTLGLGWRMFARIDAAYDRGEIDTDEWHRLVGAIIGPAYLAATDPRAQSGSSSTPAQWEQARRFVFACVDREGTLLDVGCANGYLMECATAWLAKDNLNVEPYGVEILPELAALARRRLPRWADRITTANAADWIPERPFDFARAGLEYVPPPLRAHFVHHLLEFVVAPGGRLIVGPHSEPAGSLPEREQEAASWGLRIAGRVEVRHAEDARVVRRAFWIDKETRRKPGLTKPRPAA